MSGRTVLSDCSAPAGLPGKFKTRDVPKLAQTPRESAAKGVCFIPACRITSPTPSMMRSQTARVASGVTSRAAMPVPPVVTIKRASPESSRSVEAIRSMSSGTILELFISKPASAKTTRSRGPEASWRRPLWHESLTVTMAAGIFTRPERSLPHRGWLHRVAGDLPSGDLAWSVWCSARCCCR